MSETNWNSYRAFNTALRFKIHKNFFDYFKNMVTSRPKTKAIVTNKQTITFEELDNKVNALASILSNLKIKNCVAFYGDHSITKICTILASIKIGLRVVPITLTSSEFLIKHYLNTTKCKVVLTTNEHVDELQHFLQKTCKVIPVEINDFSDVYIPNVMQPKTVGDIAYFVNDTEIPIYINTKSLINQAVWIYDKCGLNNDSVGLQVVEGSFYSNMIDLPLLALFGVPFHIIESKQVFLPSILCKVINEHQVSYLSITLNFLKILLKYLEQIPSAITQIKFLKHILIYGKGDAQNVIKDFLELTAKQLNVKIIDIYETCNIGTLCA
jgi:acyl-coenzyme A synthetase/AMP-(fatty) acid ligase